MTPSTLVARFEAGALSPDAFDHAAHLYLAAHCALTAPRALALDALRARLQAFLRHNGVQTTRDRGYHETLTRFWFERVVEVIDAEGPLSLDTLAPRLRARLGDKRVVLDRYSRDRLMSWAARTGWLPPDRPAQGVNERSQHGARIAG